MGKLTFAGFTEEQAATLRRRWSMATGAVFDSSYPPKFQFEEITRGMGLTGTSSALDANPEARTVDVKFVRP
jgi:hypothetical protein